MSKSYRLYPIGDEHPFHNAEHVSRFAYRVWKTSIGTYKGEPIDRGRVKIDPVFLGLCDHHHHSQARAADCALKRLRGRNK